MQQTTFTSRTGRVNCPARFRVVASCIHSTVGNPRRVGTNVCSRFSSRHSVFSGGKAIICAGGRKTVSRVSRSPLAVLSMFERFTEKAIKVVMLAQEEARRMGHNVVGTEQLLLGLCGEQSGVASKVLRNFNVYQKDARLEVERIVGRGSGFVPVELPFTPTAKKVLEMSLEEAKALGHSYIGTEHILLGLLREADGVSARVLAVFEADAGKIRAEILRTIADPPEAVASSSSSSSTASAGGSGSKKEKGSALAEFGTNLTQQAKDGKLDPVVGRAEQIQRVVQILGRRTKNNPCLIGEPGVGKTAVAEGLASRIASGDVPVTIRDKQVWSLDMGLLVAGTKFRGEFEERLKKLLAEVKDDKDIILMIDEVHTLVGAGAAEGAIDAAQLLKPALARGELQCIGATTLDEYRKHIEKDPALERRFQPVTVPEPSVEETFEILQGLKARYELHHKLRFSDYALMAAASFSSQYISDRFLPDKAIDLMDEAGSRVRLRNLGLPAEAEPLNREMDEATELKEAAIKKSNFELANKWRARESELRMRLAALMMAAKERSGSATSGAADSPLTSDGMLRDKNGEPVVVSEEDIANIVSQWTGIPVEKVSSAETEKLLKMEEMLAGRVVGQNAAVAAIARAIRRARVGLKSPNRPVASFVFAGPTGVGKTELARALATYYFGSEEAMIRLDMSEFMERHEVAKLIGSPPGYVGYDEGGQLTEAVRRRPYTLVLFDEIEKAHPDVFNMMLQILEDGRLTDSKGRTVNFKNTMIIMTSNVGAKAIMGAGRSPRFFLRPDDEDAAMEDAGDFSSYPRIKSLVNEEMKSYFRPEFLNRLDDIIVFRQLTRREVTSIVDIMLKEVLARTVEKGFTVDVTDRFKELLVSEGYAPEYGARPLRRAIMRLVEDSLAERLLNGDIIAGDRVLLDQDDDGAVAVIVGGKSMKQDRLLVPSGIA